MPTFAYAFASNSAVVIAKLEDSTLPYKCFPLNFCGISNGYIRSVNKTPGADKISKILSAYPNLNPNWLLTGEGSMLIDSDGNEQGIGNITGNKISGVNNVIGSRSVSVHNIDKSATEEMLIRQIDLLMNQISQQEKIIASLTRLLEKKVDGEKYSA